MEEIDQQPASEPPAPPIEPPQQPALVPPPPVSPDVALAEQLARCHKAIGECFVCSDRDDLSFMSQLECLNVAERLIRVSIVLAAAIGKSGKEFTHRIIVERPAPMLDVAPEGAEYPPPPKPKSKTIHGGRGPRVHNMEAGSE